MGGSQNSELHQQLQEEMEGGKRTLAMVTSVGGKKVWDVLEKKLRAKMG